MIELKVPGLGIWGGRARRPSSSAGWFLYDRTGGVAVSPLVIVAGRGLRGVVLRVRRREGARDAAHATAPRAPRRSSARRASCSRGGLEPGRRRARGRRGVAGGRAGGLIPDGAKVRVTRLDGLVLTVEPLRSRARAGRRRPRRPRRREDLMDFSLIASRRRRAVRAGHPVPGERDQDRARVPAPGGVPPGPAARDEGPGPHPADPVRGQGVKVDLREFYLEIPRQDSITKDNAPISIDFIMYYKVLDPAMSVVQVGNFAGAAHEHRGDHPARGRSVTSRSTTCSPSATRSTSSCA